MQKTLRRLSKLTFWLLFTLASGTAVTAAGIYLYLSPNLPNVDDLYEVKLQIPLRIYTIDGELIGEFGEKRRTPIKYQDVPEQFVRALLAAEDSNFEKHSGVAIRGLIRATAELITTGEKQTGGSTITMQVARNFFLSREQTFTRKFNEILLALEIERKLTKQQIFELYVNKIFWGNRAYGVEAAARVYYGKGVQELSLAQCAMIAGLPKAPSRFNPIVNPERALTRRNWILQRMLELGYIEPPLYEEAVNEPITAELHGAEIAVSAPYAAELARSELLERFGREVYDSGMDVYTTIRADRQAAANKAVRAGIMEYDQRHGYRGPEGHSYDADDAEANQENWQAMLEDSRVINGLVPAIVTAVADQHVEILLADGGTGRVEFENGIKQARSYISEDQLGPEINSAQEVAQIGDLVRVFDIAQRDSAPPDSEETAAEPIEAQWQLTQLPKVQAALVSMNARNGALQAVVGGFDFTSSKYNRATQGERQPGSNFKPFIYAAALDRGFTAASLFNDAPVVMADAELENTWRPENASGKFYGPTRLRKALYLSRNLVSVRLLRTITPKAAINYVESFGFDAERLPKDLSLSLGSHAVTPLEVARGYATFANGGYLVDPYIIDRIVADDGEVVFQANPVLANCPECEPAAEPEAQPAADSNNETKADSEADNDEEATEEPPAPIAAPRVIDDRIAYIIDNILQDVVRRGTGVKAQALKRQDIAGKTGTTNGPVDAWFSGYNPSLVTSVWLGFDQNHKLGRGEYGGSAALPIWINYMQQALQGQEEQARTRPNGITSMRIDPKTGLLASPLQDDGIFELFRVENSPVERAPDPMGLYPEDLDMQEGGEPGQAVERTESLEELF